MIEEAVTEALVAAGLDVGRAGQRRLAEYAEIVLTANAAQNLTALRSPQLFAAAGIVDSLLAWQALGLPAQPVLDVGSGNGLPAVPWLVLGWLPSARLLEAERRKVEFLHGAAGTLGLALEVTWGRAEELARSGLRDMAPLVTARALAPAPIAVEVAGGLVRPGGHLALLKGPQAEGEAAAAAPVAKRMGFGPVEMRAYRLPNGQERFVLVYHKERPTPKDRPVAYARLRREFAAKPMRSEREGADEGE